MTLRLAFAGGGTGGHVVPGLHVLAHLEQERPDVLWFGAGRAVEDRTFASVGPPAGTFPLERVALRLEPPGGGAPSLARVLARAPIEALAARRALRRHGSRVLLGLGGYTVVPAVLAARSLGLPIVLLEINAVSGRATRYLRRFARRVVHAWPSTLPAPASPRDVHWGPPLAPAFARERAGADGDPACRLALGLEPERPLLLVLGGSQGALGLNRWIAAEASALLAGGLQVLHQTGPGRLDEGAPPAPGYRAVEFLDDVCSALDAATVVLCRGGASTLAEIGARARPAAVVPYPHHPDRHQERNARLLGAGVRIVPEAELGSATTSWLVRLAGPEGRDERTAMGEALAGSVPADAAERLADELRALAG